MTEIVAMVAAYADAEAGAARAALAEPDDDRYLALRARFTAFLGPGLGPVVDRFAVPGGRAELRHPEAAQDIAPRTLFAVAGGTTQGTPAWIAYVSGLREPDSIDHALGIVEQDGRPVVAGRRAVNPFADMLEWEAAGGADIRFDGPAAEVVLERLPDDTEQAAFLRRLTGG